MCLRIKRRICFAPILYELLNFIGLFDSWFILIYLTLWSLPMHVVHARKLRIRLGAIPALARTPPIFRPLSARYMVSAKANRHDADERPLPHFFYASGAQDGA
jgi:hypothetical protein